MNIMKSTQMSTNTGEEGSKRLATVGGRIIVIAIIALMGFSGFGIRIAKAEAPDAQALIALNKGIENYFVARSQKDLSQDERAQYIENYFTRLNLPAADYAKEFVIYADKYGIDWRLLPAITLAETTGCKHTLTKFTKRINNCWGYGNMSFDTIEEGIAYVSHSLAGQNSNTAHYYADKDLKTMLYAYNSVNPKYYGIVTGAMEDIFSQAEFFKRQVPGVNA